VLGGYVPRPSGPTGTLTRDGITHQGCVVAVQDRGVLIGTWAVAPQAGEWFHQASRAIRAGIPVGELLDAVAQFPTHSEAYLAALEKLDL
jgi:pyruvate/2-oxoglutarate dehydrogenase complex dihydrolipoamide dehydrogenase (E3) component